jgi:hypothetical protein
MTHIVAADTTAGSDVEIAELAFVFGIVALLVVFVLVLLRQGVAVYRTRVVAGREEQLRELLAASAASLERHAVAVERAEAQLADLSQRFTALERVLKDVE